jgi:hypothetical protein
MRMTHGWLVKAQRHQMLSNENLPSKTKRSNQVEIPQYEKCPSVEGAANQIP